MTDRHPLRIAHRGARDEAPENTFTAFERALAYATDGIELDIQLSADGTAIIYHDATLHKITGRRFRVSGQTRQKLALLDWGRWFGSKFAGEPLATLEETLARFAPRTRLLLEIKSYPADQRSGRTNRLTREVIRLLGRMPAAVPQSHIYILSFDSDALQSAHQLAPQWHYVLNAGEEHVQTLNHHSIPQLSYLHAIDVRIDRLNARIIQWARQHGLKVFTYTCNHPRQVGKALDLGVDAILSDRPGWLTGYLDR